jgi:hypothetical protein
MTPRRLKRIRQLLWLYFWLLIFEGALRKWVLPGLSNPLLLVRDPIALLALWWGWPLLAKRPWSAWIQPLLLIGPIAFLLALTVGHGDLFTALYGTRVMVLQLPLIFLYGAVFDRADVIRFSWVLLWLSIPMAALIAAQSNLPDSHILNVGPGGQGTAAFTGALGRSRPPGTFSFISGVASFFSLAAASLFILLYNTRTGLKERIFSIVAGIALVVAMPVSISRSLLAGYLMVVAGVFGALVLSRTRVISLILGLVAVLLAVGVATTVPAFQATSEAFVARWEMAGKSGDYGVERSEVGDLGVATAQIQGRVLPGFTGPLSNLENIPLLGYGIGMGTNVGAQRLSGELVFLIGEGGWENSLGELGVSLGLTFLIWRVALAVWMLRLALRAAVQGNRMPLILLGASFIPVLNGQLSQPTGLGFIVLSGGLTLAALNTTLDTHGRPLGPDGTS